MKTSFSYSLLALAAATTFSFTGAVSAQEITGAGASFPAPIYAKWASDYNKATGVKTPMTVVKRTQRVCFLLPFRFTTSFH